MDYLIKMNLKPNFQDKNGTFMQLNAKECQDKILTQQLSFIDCVIEVIFKFLKIYMSKHGRHFNEIVQCLLQVY